MWLVVFRRGKHADEDELLSSADSDSVGVHFLSVMDRFIVVRHSPKTSLFDERFYDDKELWLYELNQRCRNGEVR